MPTAREVLELQKMADRAAPPRILQLLDSALDIFRELVQPVGALEDFPIDAFGNLYEGNGMNSLDGPVPSIVARADAVAVFAATMGDALASKSRELFTQGSATLGYMMDAVNSSGAERLGGRMCRLFLEHLPEELRNKKLKAQYYCPGHCGWHISGQEKLFETLRPEEIGMTINSRWVMQPFKSISGVLVAGEMCIHRFPPGFSFCPQCRERKCASRLRILESA